LQPRPQLTEPRQIEVDAPGQALLQATAAVDTVIAQLHSQGAERPGLPGTLCLDLEHRRLPAQAPLEVELGIQAELFALHFALAAQRPGQGAGQLREPVRRVQR